MLHEVFSSVLKGQPGRDGGFGPKGNAGSRGPPVSTNQLPQRTCCNPNEYALEICVLILHITSQIDQLNFHLQ